MRSLQATELCTIAKERLTTGCKVSRKMRPAAKSQSLRRPRLSGLGGYMEVIPETEFDESENRP